MWVPELRWSSSKGVSIRQITQELIAARLGNPKLTSQHGWNTDYATVEAEVERYLAKVCETMGWTDYYISDAGTTAGGPRPFQPASPPPGPVQRSAGHVVAGNRTIREMFGQDGLVNADLAEKRAGVCAKCPMNVNARGWLDEFTSTASSLFRWMLETLRTRSLKTSLDDQLGICQSCDCPMRLKVWATLAHINKHMPAQSRASLHPACWILAESQ